MYGLKQAAILVFQQLAERLEKAGYSQILSSLVIWNTKPDKLFSTYLLIPLLLNNLVEKMRITS